MKSFLHFSSGEWVAATFLLSLIVSSFIFYYLYSNNNESPYDIKFFQKEVDTFEKRQEKIADSIENERIRKNEHYKKSYSENRRKNNFIKYSENSRSIKDTFQKRVNYEEYRQKYKKQGYEIIRIDINSCDTSEICTVPQFGSKRAKKITEYRKRLGGFYSFTQIKEIYIMQNVELSHIEKYFFIDQNKIRKIEINTADYKILASHPYFDSYLSKSIINYRKREGRIKSKEELRKATNAYPELMDKILPYISFD